MEPADWPRTQKAWKIDQEVIFISIFFDNFVPKYLLSVSTDFHCFGMNSSPYVITVKIGGNRQEEFRNEIVEKNTPKIISWSIFHVF